MGTRTNSRADRERRFSIEQWYNPVVFLVEIDEQGRRHHFRWSGRDWVVEERDDVYTGVVTDAALQPDDLPWWWGEEITSGITP